MMGSGQGSVLDKTTYIECPDQKANKNDINDIDDEDAYH